MPLFSSSTPFDGEVEKATNELNTTEDWAIIIEICDRVQISNGSKDCLKSIVKRLNHKVPFVAMQALTLLDACISNCGHNFHLEVASRDFISESRTIIGKGHPKVGQRLKQLIQKWSENEFKSDASLSLIPSLYNSLKSEGHSFVSDDPPVKSSQPLSKDPNVVSSEQEQDDIAKAIALSLKETENKSGGSKSKNLYPAFAAPVSTISQGHELRKVRALYDFEAAEDNELTFKTGEFINVIDDSDPNWWKGSNFRGEGLFPANFATADLSAEPESTTKEKKSVQFSEDVEVKTMEPLPEIVEIDEERIDKTLAMLQNADPTGETSPDPPDMLPLEEQCKAMNPLIDLELEKIDRKHLSLIELNAQVIQAFQMYHSLMKELPGYGYTGMKMVPPGVPQVSGAQGSLPQLQSLPQHQQVYNGPADMPSLPPGHVAPPMMSGQYLPPSSSLPPQGGAVAQAVTTETASHHYSMPNSIPSNLSNPPTSYLGQPAQYSNAPSGPPTDVSLQGPPPGGPTYIHPATQQMAAPQQPVTYSHQQLL